MKGGCRAGNFEQGASFSEKTGCRLGGNSWSAWIVWRGVGLVNLAITDLLAVKPPPFGWIASAEALTF